jgi:hypothetical protein
VSCVLAAITYVFIENNVLSMRGPVKTTCIDACHGLSSRHAYPSHGLHVWFRKADMVFMHPIWNMHQTYILASTRSIDEDPASWLCSNARTTLPRNQNTGIILYTWWNTWKERNKRIFDFEQRSEQVAFAAKEEIDLCA